MPRYKNEPINFSVEPKIPSSISLRSCGGLLSAWRFSAHKLDVVAKALRAEFKEEKWFSVLVAGSYGRMDAGKRSDADFLIITNGNRSKPESDAIIEKIRKILKDLGLAMPNPNGLFSTSIDSSTITEDIGGQGDDLHKLARRMVLLLETKCIYNEVLCDSTRYNLVKAYLRYQEKEPTKHALFLLNDLIRYFRSIVVNYELTFWDDNKNWPIRLAKLRHSRVLMYYSLLLSILNSSIKDDKLEYILGQIKLTPLERICHVYAECGEHDVSSALGPYSIFVTHLNDSRFRDRLSKANYDNRYDFPQYELLKSTSVAFGTELTRFILDRRGHWPHRIFTELFVYL